MTQHKPDVPGTASPTFKWNVSEPDEMQHMIHQIALDKGWWDEGVDDRNRGEIYMNIASEVSEAWEEWRKTGKTALYYVHDSNENKKPEGAAVELADCVIRIMDFLEAEGFSLWGLIAIKMAYNETREQRHGGKFA